MQKSSRAHAAAPPLPIKPASPGFDRIFLVANTLPSCSFDLVLNCRHRQTTRSAVWASTVSAACGRCSEQEKGQRSKKRRNCVSPNAFSDTATRRGATMPQVRILSLGPSSSQAMYRLRRLFYFMQKSSRAHAAAPPLPIKPASPGFDRIFLVANTLPSCSFD